MFINVSAIIVHNEKVLIIQRGLKNKYYPGLWAVPGGGKEREDLTIQDTAERETFEELGLKVKATNIVVQNNFQEVPEGMFFKILCKLASDDDFERNYDYSDEVNDFKWVTSDQIDNYEFTPFTKQEIKSTLENY